MEPVALKIAEIAAQSLIGVGAILIALVSARSSRDNARLQAWQAYLDAWESAEQTIIAQQGLRELFARGEVPTDDVQRIQLDSYLFLYLNIADLAVHAWRNRAISRAHLDAEFEIVWKKTGIFSDRLTAMAESACFAPEIRTAFARFAKDNAHAQP